MTGTGVSEVASNKAPAHAPNGSEQYNDVFDHLVGPNGDLQGMVAYALYKTAKREWIIGHTPNEAERSAYYKTVTQTQLEVYRAEAKERLLRFATSLFTEKAQQIADAAVRQSIAAELADHHTRTLAEIKKQNSFWTNAGASVVGSIVFTALLLLAGILRFAPGVQDFLKGP